MARTAKSAGRNGSRKTSKTAKPNGNGKPKVNGAKQNGNGNGNGNGLAPLRKLVEQREQAIAAVEQADRALAEGMVKAKATHTNAAIAEVVGMTTPTAQQWILRAKRGK
jgi:hypothetical protein